MESSGCVFLDDRDPQQGERRNDNPTSSIEDTIMKKNATFKLQLNRETLRNLEPEKLADVVGGRPCVTSGMGSSEPTCVLCDGF